MADEQLILVDENNRAVGAAGKDAVHRAGLLHRAFSIFVVDDRGRILLQRRSPRKYHSGGLWANSCCGHPRPGERTVAAAQRRLNEELGVASTLSFGFFSRYQADL
ncbi:MAG: isopentenyl-diphosphate Delta-isomerase, partial [Alphaproteobacteria bacterium]|nr:isopentenyl-diphosphate Delta-isomerase [Alphaproteobacteria bacterium]